MRISDDSTPLPQGMAVYADDLPAGKDVRFNTNKSEHMIGDNGRSEKMKPTDNRLAQQSGAQMEYIDKDGKEIVPNPTS